MALLQRAGTALAGYLSGLAVPLAVLFAVMLLAFVTSPICAWITGGHTGGLRALVKKLMNLFLVAVAMAADYLIFALTDITGLKSPEIGLVALVVIVWLAVRELAAVLKDLAAAGVPVPDFLVRVVHRLTATAEAVEDPEDSQDSQGAAP